MANVLSWQVYPRYLHRYRQHMEPVVVAATRRILFDDSTVDITEISAAEYLRIVAPMKVTEEREHGLHSDLRPIG